jgi:hypothetical protein
MPARGRQGRGASFMSIFSPSRGDISGWQLEGALSLCQNRPIFFPYIFLLTKKKIWINLYGRIGPETKMPAKLRD